MPLTSLDNFHRMMRHEQPQWLPFDIQATPPIVDVVEKKKGTRNLVEAFSLDFVATHPNYQTDAGRWRRAFADIGFPLPDDVEIGFAGVTHKRPRREDVGEAYHFREMLHPLSAVTSVDQLKRLPWPDWSRTQAAAVYEGVVRDAHERGRPIVGWLECTIFEFAWYLRGMDNLFADLIDDNGIGAWLLDWFTQRSVYAVSAMAQAGVDVIGLGDDVGTQRGMMMSVEFWRQHLRPRLKRVIDAIRANQGKPVYVRYHSDGDIRAIIPDLIEIGVDILNPVQPECMPPGEVIPQYQDHLAFWGMIGTQSTMPFGTPDDVRAAVAQCAELARHGAAVIVAPTHVLEPDVPWENIEALVQAVREQRL